MLLRNKRENKLTPAFDPQPYTVVGRKGSMISAKRGERVVTRNTSFFKHIPLIHQNNPESDRDDDDVIIEVDDVQQSRPADQAPSSPDAQECSDDGNPNATPRSKPKSRVPKSRETTSRETTSREMTPHETTSPETTSRETTPRETTSRQTSRERRYPVRLRQRPRHLSNFKLQ